MHSKIRITRNLIYGEGKQACLKWRQCCVGSWARREPALGLAVLGRQEGGDGGTPVPGGMAV